MGRDVGGPRGGTSVEHDLATSIRVRVPAKINLHLAVGPRRPDGYHDIVSIMQTVSLHDLLRIRGAAGGPAAHPSARRLTDVSLTLDGLGAGTQVPADASNLVLVAAERLMARAGIGADRRVDGADGPGPAKDAASGPGPAVHLHLTKHIPVAAGMAGGSADAAAALVGLDRLWGLDLGQEVLRELAATIGADVTFCLVGGTALATGVGQSVARVLTRGTSHWVIGIDERPLATADVYAAFDELPPPVPTEPDLVLHALRTGDVETLAAALHNDLQPAALVLRPVLAERRAAMLDAGALASIVSGSGPTLLGLATDAMHARRIAARLDGVFDRLEIATSPAGGPELIAEHHDLQPFGPTGESR
jgi:4-diphosphocytidyl-2-C-methyl-D-erythritol kinase